MDDSPWITPIPAPARDFATRHPVRYGKVDVLGVPIFIGICPAYACGWYESYIDKRGVLQAGEEHASDRWLP